MAGILLVYGLFAYGCIEGVRRPWIGLVVFYSFVVLEPTWNWRWSIDPTFPYQKYIAASTILGLALTGFRHAKVSGNTYRALASLVAFVLIAYVSALQSINEAFSYEYMGYIWKIALMAVLTVWLIDTPRKIWVLLWVAVICQGYNAYQINLQYFQEGFSRYAVYGWGTKGDNNLYSIFTVPIIAIAAGLTVYGRTIWQQLIAGGILLMQMHVLMLLESRGTMIGGLVLAAMFAVVVPKTKKVWGMIATAVVCGVILAGPSVVSEFSSAFASNEKRDSSAASRFQVWTAGAIITAENPILGVGPNAGRFLVPQYVPSETREHKALHNLLFEISTGCGVPATLLYLSYFGLIFLDCFKLLMRKRHQLPDWAAVCVLAVVCGVPGYWAASMFSSGAVLESSYLMVSLGGAGLMTYRRLSVKARKCALKLQLANQSNHVASPLSGNRQNSGILLPT